MTQNSNLEYIAQDIRNKLDQDKNFNPIEAIRSSAFSDTVYTIERLNVEKQASFLAGDPCCYNKWVEGFIQAYKKFFSADDQNRFVENYKKYND